MQHSYLFITCEMHISEALNLGSSFRSRCWHCRPGTFLPDATTNFHVHDLLKSSTHKKLYAQMILLNYKRHLSLWDLPAFSGFARSNNGWIISAENTEFFCQRFKTRTIFAFSSGGHLKRWVNVVCMFLANLGANTSFSWLNYTRKRKMMSENGNSCKSKQHTEMILIHLW